MNFSAIIIYYNLRQNVHGYANTIIYIVIKKQIIRNKNTAKKEITMIILFGRHLKSAGIYGIFHV